MSRQYPRGRRVLHGCLSFASVFVMLLAVVGCGATAPTPAPPAVGPAATSETPAPTATAVPTATATPTPHPPVRRDTACVPAPGIQPVSSAVVFTGDMSKMWVSLTFDSDGGSAGNAYAYLNILRIHHIHATFFLTGDFAQANSAVVQRIIADGHDLGNHTVDHPNLTNPTRSDEYVCWELTHADRMIVDAGGRTSRPFFRPPYGDYSEQVRKLAAGLGYRTIYWTVDPRDWDPATSTQDIINRVVYSPKLKSGAIILMHINSPHEAQALDAVINGLQSRGYAIDPLSQLVQ